MTSSSCLLSDLNGAADAAEEVKAEDNSSRPLLSPPNKSDVQSTECSITLDNNGTYVRVVCTCITNTYPISVYLHEYSYYTILSIIFIL